MENIISNNKKYTTILLLAIVSILSVLIIPVCNLYYDEGILPKFDYWAFGEVLEEIADDPEDAFHYYYVCLTIFSFVASLLLLLFAFCKIKKMIIVTCFGGIISMVYKLIDFIDGYGVDDVIGLDTGEVCIGFWISLAIFVVCLIYSFSIETVQERPEE